MTTFATNTSARPVFGNFFAALSGLVETAVHYYQYLQTIKQLSTLSREELFRNSKLTTAERQDLFAAFLSVTQWVPIYYTWRPNLRDEADNHVIDLAIAGNAEYIITKNTRDFASMDLKFPDLTLATAATFMETWRKE